MMNNTYWIIIITIFSFKRQITLENQNKQFRQIYSKEQVPYELLLLADPSIEMIDEYLKSSFIFIAEQNKKIVGVIVLSPLSEDLVEIKNIAVEPEFQGQGIGSYLIENMISVAIEQGYKEICIGTANSSIGQLYLYQKLGFEFYEIKKNFFILHYPDKILENGIQAKHMIVLKRQL